MDHIIIHPAFAALAGWLAFNLMLFRIEKDQADDHGKLFDLPGYVSRTWDNWLVSLIFIPVILYIGYKQLDIGMIDATHVTWSDLYYLGAGVLPEFCIVTWKKWKAKNK